MPIHNYGVLKGQAIRSKPGQGQNPHYQIQVVSENTMHRIAINVQSQSSPSELLYYVEDNYHHDILPGLEALGDGFHLLRGRRDLCLDYIRGNFFNVEQMKPLPYNVPGPDNDLNELLHKYVTKSIDIEDALVYAFGEKWGPEEKIDRYFGFKPGNGIHDIHMNQGNAGQWVKDNGVWQDGGLLLQFPKQKRWIAVFLAFQSQAFHTDDETGNRIDNAISCDLQGAVKIICALLNTGNQPRQSISLLNRGESKLSLDGWAFADRQKRRQYLKGYSIEPGSFLSIPVDDTINLSKDGGIITLLDNKGIKIDGVSYTRKDCQKEGWTTKF
ncbi:MAG: DUF2278 family protein [Candidatus Brocadiae bacterium]|nr:DUF2278 family protein [Candidatus Brocadiia bacterium]